LHHWKIHNYGTAVDILKSSWVHIFITSIIQAATFKLEVGLSISFVYANVFLANTRKTRLRIKQIMTKIIYHPIGMKLSVKKRNERMSLDFISSTNESRYKCRMLNRAVFIWVCAALPSYQLKLHLAFHFAPNLYNS
jgi:uncharacterized protein YacL